MRFITPLLKTISWILIWVGAAITFWGSLQPWIVIRVLKSIDVGLSGIFFMGGLWCFALSALILLGLRRSPLLCVIAAAFALHFIATARIDAPRRAKHNMIEVELRLFPLNRLLDQFHLPDVEPSDWHVPNPQMVGPGLDVAWKGALLLLAGGLLGAPVDPLLTWTMRRVRRSECRHCHTRWPYARHAVFCPQCGTPTPLYSPLLCRVCHTVAKPADHYCIACGNSLQLLRS